MLKIKFKATHTHSGTQCFPILGIPAFAQDGYPSRCVDKYPNILTWPHNSPMQTSVALPTENDQDLLQEQCFDIEMQLCNCQLCCFVVFFGRSLVFIFSLAKIPPQKGKENKLLLQVQMHSSCKSLFSIYLTYRLTGAINSIHKP